MLQQFVLDLKLHKKAYLGLLFPLAFFLVGVLVVVLSMNFDPETTQWFCAGTLLALFCVVIFGLLHGLFYRQELLVALSMGRTRKDFMAAFALRMLLWLTAGYLLALLLYHAEHALYPALFPGCGNEVPFDFLMDLRIILPCILGITVTAMFIGALYCYNPKLPAVIYFVWMALYLSISRLSVLLDYAVRVPAAAWISLGIAALLAMSATTVCLGRKQMVQ